MHTFCSPCLWMLPAQPLNSMDGSWLGKLLPTEVVSASIADSSREETSTKLNISDPLHAVQPCLCSHFSMSESGDRQLLVVELLNMDQFLRLQDEKSWRESSKNTTASVRLHLTSYLSNGMARNTGVTVQAAQAAQRCLAQMEGREAPCWEHSSTSVTTATAHGPRQALQLLWTSTFLPAE